MFVCGIFSFILTRHVSFSSIYIFIIYFQFQLFLTVYCVYNNSMKIISALQYNYKNLCTVNAHLLTTVGNIFLITSSIFPKFWGQDFFFKEINTFIYQGPKVTVKYIYNFTKISDFK